MIVSRTIVGRISQILLHSSRDLSRLETELSNSIGLESLREEVVMSIQSLDSVQQTLSDIASLLETLANLDSDANEDIEKIVKRSVRQVKNRTLLLSQDSPQEAAGGRDTGSETEVWL